MHYSDADTPALLRPRDHSKGALVTLAFMVAVLVALVGTVHTISATTDENQDRRELATAADAAIRAADNVQASASAAALGAPGETDLDDATAALVVQTDAVRDALGDPDASVADLDAYLGAAVALADADPTNPSVEDLTVAHDAVVGSLESTRAAALGDLTSGEDLTDRLAIASLGLAALLLPSTAIFMYVLLTRRRRETVELAEDLVATRQAVSRSGSVLELTTDRVAGAMEAANERLQALDVEDDELSEALTTALRDADDLDALVRFSQSGCVHDLGPASILDILVDARDDLGLDQLELTAVSRDALVWADPHTATHAVRSLLWLARTSNPNRLVATTGADEQWVHCLITYSGDPLDPSLVRSLFEERIADDIWDTMHDPAGLALAVARTLLETAGARLIYRSKANANQFHLRFPSPVAPHLAAATVPDAVPGEPDPVAAQ